MIEPVLDHAVIDVRDHIDDAASLFRRLGFSVTARGYHTLGSANHIAVFGSNYLELLGWEKDARLTRQELEPYPVGLNGLVFRATDADTLCVELAQRGLPTRPPLSLSRRVRLPNGAESNAEFRTVRFEPGTFGAMRTYFCEHFTPELVWREEWSVHPNGATDIARIMIQAEQPHRIGTLFATMFGEAHAHLDGERCVLEAENARIEILPRSELAPMFRDAMPNLHGRDEAIAVLTLRTTSLRTTAQALSRGEIPTMQIGNDRIIVPAESAMNVTLEFLEER